MTTVAHIYKSIDQIAPFSTALSFDNVGVLVGSANAPVTRVLLALDVTKEVVEEAKALGIELIIAHHPPIFHPLRNVTPNSVVWALVQNNISVLACHTNLDMARLGGVNQALAEALGITGVKAEGSVLLGRLPQPMTMLQFAALVKGQLGSAHPRFTPTEKILTTIAFWAGAGGEFVYDLQGKADVFLTGEARHDEWIFAKAHIPMLAAGHYETEKPFAQLLKAYLAEQHKEITWMLSAAEENPVVGF